MLCEACKWNSYAKRMIKKIWKLKKNDYVIVLTKTNMKDS